MVERRLLDAHLGHCAGCRTFAQHVAVIAAELRAAAPARRCRRFVLPAAAVRRPSHRLRNGASTAAVAVSAMAFGIALQQPAIDAPPPLPAPQAPPAEVEDAEQHALRLFRREALLQAAAALGSPSGAFGTRPA